VRSADLRGRYRQAFVWFERTVLSAGMTVLALGVERLLVRAIKKGGVEPAPRTAAEQDETRGAPSGTEEREAHVSTVLRT
jgi:hypothetical protein